MSRSATAEAKDWITGLKPNTWFWSKDVPGSSGVVHPVLSHLHNDEASEVQRISRGLYWRGWPAGQEPAFSSPNPIISALLTAGPGAGLARGYALNRLGWTTQVPCKYLISALNEPPEAPHKTVVYRPNKNQRRSELNWEEVTLLEAVNFFWYSEEPWHECLDVLRSGKSMNRLPWSLVQPVRPDRLNWAAEAEDGASVETLRMVEEIVEVFGQT